MCKPRIRPSRVIGVGVGGECMRTLRGARFRVLVLNDERFFSNLACFYNYWLGNICVNIYEFSTLDYL